MQDRTESQRKPVVCLHFRQRTSEPLILPRVLHKVWLKTELTAPRHDPVDFSSRHEFEIPEAEIR